MRLYILCLHIFALFYQIRVNLLHPSFVSGLAHSIQEIVKFQGNLLETQDKLIRIQSFIKNNELVSLKLYFADDDKY